MNSYTEAINLGYKEVMQSDPTVVAFGLGINDPKRIFGTTDGLLEMFGGQRVFDTPTSENGMTGIGIGMALGGLKPIMVHQRLDFFLLAMDQLVNSAAKWNYMFGGKQSVPITIRLITGRGWGQGPTHSQSLHSWFAHIPGLRVYMPSTPSDAFNCLVNSTHDPNPCIIIEHRWLHGSSGEIHRSEDIDLPRLVVKGSDITVVCLSYATVEAQRAGRELNKYGISCEIIDIRCVSPLSLEGVFHSVEQTGRLLVLDTSWGSCSVGSDVIRRVCESCFDSLKIAPKLMSLPSHPEPTSYGLTRGFHYTAREIAESIVQMTGQDAPLNEITKLQVNIHHDVPGDWFKGPF
jgi:pyruvate/2-oxoglutarate/acetoin dehydrogenase E1 component